MYEVINLLGRVLCVFESESDAHDYADMVSDMTGNYHYVEVIS